MGLLVRSVGVVGVLEVPERPAARRHGDGVEVVRRRGGGGRPLEGPGVPGAVPRERPATER